MKNGAVGMRDASDIAYTLHSATARYTGWLIVAFSGLFFLFLSGLGINLYKWRLPLLPVPGTLSAEKQSELTDPSRHKRILQEKIEKRQALLKALETHVSQIERVAQIEEEELASLYRRISDIKGGIESDKSKLRLRGNDCSP